MKPYLCAVLFLLLLLGELPIFSFAQTDTAPQQASDVNIRKTIFVKYISPVAIVRLLGSGQASLIPKGVEQVSPNSSDGSLTVRGTPEAIAELESILRLLDVKQRTVAVQTKLFEIRLGEDGKEKGTLVLSPEIATRNNIKAQCTFSTEGQSTTIAVLPHVNGDGSTTLQVVLGLSRLAYSSEVTTNVRVSKQQEWQTVRTISLSHDRRIQEAMQSGLPPTPAAYPLYRLEVLVKATE